MKYNFTDVIDRSGKDAFAFDSIGKLPGFAPASPKDDFDFIPMWVADMNFATAPSVTDALIKRIQHPLYGYFDTSDAYYQAIITWQCVRNGVSGLERQHIGYENSVINGMLSALRVLCSPGDPVLIHSPTYITFTSALKDNGYHMVTSPLKQDGNGTWRMDYADMERKIVQHRIHVAIFCSPHNPTGRVWNAKELQQMMELFQRYDVTVISDEIWSDIILGNHKHIPLQLVSEDARNRTIALYACTKTFNLAGLRGAYHIIYNRRLRQQITRLNKKTYGTELNVLSMHAVIGAYNSEGQQWTDELLCVLTQNVRYAYEFISTHFHGISVSAPQGTYMLFLDCSQWCAENGKSLDELLQAGYDVGVGWQDGRPFFGPCHIRMNVALPYARLKEAMKRLEQYVFSTAEA